LLMVYLIKQIDERWTDHPTLRSTLTKLVHQQSAQWRRGSAGHTHIRLNTQKMNKHQEYWNVLTHEAAHVLDLGSMKGSARQKNYEFTEFWRVQRPIDDPSLDFYAISWESENVRKAEASFEDFVSGYGMHWVYEDFAETFNMYFNHHDLLVDLAENNEQIAKKYRYISQLFDGEYFRGNNQHLSAIQWDNRPRDTTKIGL
jgi:hypothetical protein